VTGRLRTADGLTLAYDDSGTGVPLLCLAGLTRNRSDFDFVRRDFGDRARIIRLDSRGRGASEHDPDWHNYTVVQEALDVLALLDHLGLDKAAILGTSRGGLIAMALAPQHRGRLLGVCLNDIGPVLEPAGLSYIRSYLGVAPPYKDYESAAHGLATANAARFATVPLERWRLHAERLWRTTPGGLALRYDPRLRDAVLAAMPEDQPVPEIWELFDMLQGLPLALIRGANSDLLSAATVAEMRRRRPDMIYAEVPDRGHVPFLDEPEATAAIAAFLDRLA
jgi:pimeloyl-ACP methyl ester carboxylesterase